MTSELFWLALSAMITGLFWLPYIANRSIVRGTPRAMGNPQPDDAPHAPWAERMIRAHNNAVENLVVMAVLVFVAHAAEVSTATTVLAVQVYFWSRLAHYMIYAVGIPYLRTLAFFIAFVCQVAVALAILGWA